MQLLLMQFSVRDPFHRRCPSPKTTPWCLPNELERRTPRSLSSLSALGGAEVSNARRNRAGRSKFRHGAEIESHSSPTSPGRLFQMLNLRDGTARAQAVDFFRVEP